MLGKNPETPVMPPLPRPMPTGVTGSLTDNERRAGENQAPQVARVLRAVTEDSGEREAKS
jgi:hypothetical protein